MPSPAARRGPGSTGHPAVAAYRVPLAAGPPGTTPLATIPVTLTATATYEAEGDTYVLYAPGSGVTPSAYLTGEIEDATTGEVARVYAQQFPYTSAPAPVQSATLNPAGGTALYSFTVSTTLATRYQVRLMRSATATTPLATSAIRTVYVIGWSRDYVNPNSDPVNDGLCPSTQPTCTDTYAITVYSRPQPSRRRCTSRNIYTCQPEHLHLARRCS